MHRVSSNADCMVRYGLRGVDNSLMLVLSEVDNISQLLCIGYTLYKIENHLCQILHMTVS